MKTANLIEYMKSRAEYEGIKWTLEDSFVENFFVQKGTRIFFGVILDDLGNVLEDRQQPAFYNSWRNHD